MSLFHSLSDNDTDQLPSDFEDESYQDTQLDLVSSAAEPGRYYDLDVTEIVLADYASDESNPVSAFRLQVTEQMFEDDGQVPRYIFTMRATEVNPPEIVLTFVPEPSGIGLIGVGMLVCLTCRKRSQVRRNEYTAPPGI